MAVVAFALLGSWAHAQVPSLQSSSDPSSSSAITLRAPEIRERSLASFERAVVGRLEALRLRWEDDSAEAPTEEIGALRQQTLSGYDDSLDRLLSELEGDGVLTLDEVTRGVGELRDRSLANLQERIRADFDHIAPPPERADHDGRMQHILALIRYTVVTRNPPQAWLLLLASVLSGVVAGGLILSAGRRLRDHCDRRKARWIRRSLDVVDGPIILASAVVGVMFGLTWIWLPTAASSFSWMVVRMLFVVAGFWLAWNLCGVVADAVGWLLSRDRSRVDHHVVDIIRKGSRLFLIVILVIFVTEVMLGSDFTGVLAGLGVLGLAVSLAAQDTLKNLFGSFTIYGDKPFQVGDLIRFAGHFGYVESIGFRSTRVRTLDDHCVSIPNADIVKNDVENVSRRRFVRRRFRLDLEFGTPVAKVREAIEIVREILESRERQPKDPPPRVVFESIGEYSLQLLVEHHHSSGDFWAAKENDSEVNAEILARFEDSGIELAFPTEVHLTRGLEPTQDGARDRDAPSRDTTVEPATDEDPRP